MTPPTVGSSARSGHRSGIKRAPARDNELVLTNATNFAFRDTLDELGARHILSPPYTPRWNGKIERFFATSVTVAVEAGDGLPRVAVGDDGAGGAGMSRGGGLVGLKDRVEALGGRLTVGSPPGAGTMLRAELPVAEPARAGGD